MTEHLTESAIGTDVLAWCTKCKNYTLHRVDRVPVGHHAGKPGPCLEHTAQWLTTAQIARRKEQLLRDAQKSLFPEWPR